MKNAVIYIHGKGGNIEEANHFEDIFKDYDVIGFDYKSQYPFEAMEEFPEYLREIKKKYESIILIANSIGAYFAMLALDGEDIAKAYLISPVVDMERLIRDMMMWANVSEKELKNKKEIATSFNESLSYDYLIYAHEHPLNWHVPTEILYGSKDHLTSYQTISDFANRVGAKLMVMDNGEHYFHTAEQMAFLDNWLINSLNDVVEKANK